MYDDDFDTRGGRGNACCLSIFAFITLALALFCLSSVTWLTDASFCQTYYYCCSFSCFYRCVGVQCLYSTWLTTRPALQDALPPPTSVGNLTGTHEFTAPGDGEYDYWSVLVTGIAVPIACLIVMCFSCAAGTGRGGPAGCSGIVLLLAAGVKIACCVCLGFQFLTEYKGQIVFNYFEQQPYVPIDTSLMFYLRNNYYMWGWAALLQWTFAFCIICIIYEIIYGVVILFTNDAKYTGVNEWSTEQVHYARKRRSPSRANTYAASSTPNAAP